MIKSSVLYTIRLSVIATIVLALLSPTVYADIDVATARIFRLGIDPRIEGPMVQLIDEGVSPQWTGNRQFYLSTALGNPGLATMLTAFSLNETVWVRIAGTGESGSLVTIIFVNAPAP